MASWLIPCSPDLYDAEAAFAEFGSLIWHQSCRVTVGNTAYIYVTAPVKELRCKCRVEAVDLPCDRGGEDGYELDEEFCSRTYRRYMDLKLLETYHTPALGYRMLLLNGLSGAIRSQRRATPELEAFIERTAAEERTVTEERNAVCR